MAYFAKQLLAKWTRGEWINDSTNDPIEGFSIDSRCIDPNQMFVALRSDTRDGHEYVGDAARRGARAALTEQVVGHSEIPQLKVKEGVNAFQAIAHQHRSNFSGPVVGITGSCGKTSTKDLLSHLLGEKRVLKTAGNQNNHLGVPLTLLRMDNQKHDFGVVEAGINMKGEMRNLAEVMDADFAMVTMIGHAHLERLKDLDTVAQEKSSLLRDGKLKEGVVFPHSCLRYRAFQGICEIPNYVLTPIGEKVPMVDWISPIHYWCLRDPIGQWKLFLRGTNEVSREFEIPNLSPGMRQNAALSILMAGQLGVSDEVIQSRLNRWCPSENRGELYRTESGWIYSDCYNANPDSMKDSLKAFHANFGESLPRLYTLGSMYELGTQSAEFHREIGESLKLRPLDRVVCVGDYADEYIAGLRRSNRDVTQWLKVESGEDAIVHVRNFEGAVFLKGSRKNRLESAIPATSQKLILDSGTLC